MTRNELQEISKKLGLNCGGKGSNKPGPCPEKARTSVKGYKTQRKASRLKKYRKGAKKDTYPKTPTVPQMEFLHKLVRSKQTIKKLEAHYLG